MPFGLIFGALFFGVLCVWVGLGLQAGQPPAMRVAGLALSAAGLALALGLLLRRPWARWAGVAGAILTAVFSLELVVAEGRVLYHLLLLAAAATATLLALPATGHPPDGPAGTPQAARRRADPLLWATGVGLAGLVLAAWWPGSATPGKPEPGASSALPASAVAPQRVRWVDFGAGLAEARAAGRPVLLTFVTGWCPYCQKMDRSTWRAAPVVARLADLVAVKVDAEDEQERGGFRGAELAERFGVQSFPSNFLVDADARVISRRDGYLTPDQLLSWIEGAVGRRAKTAPAAAALRD